jgi:hypothetical protein
MSKKPLISLLGLAALTFLGASPNAFAQSQTSPTASASPPPHHARPRIEISPRPPLYRRCVDWYELQNRPSGTVLYPQMRCWWVRR